MTPPLFDKPQFRLIRDTTRRQYATVDNELMIYSGGRDRTALVQIPAELFSIMRYLNVPREMGVQLYLDDTPIKGRMVFGLWLDDQHARDLWFLGKADMRYLLATVS